MTLRELLPADAPALAQLEQAAFGPAEAWAPTAVGSLLAQHNAVALGRDGPAGTVVGAAMGWSAGPVGELQRIAVSPGARRQGLGRVLLQAFVEACRARGAEELWLEVRADNTPALGLYRAAGFVETGRRARYYDDGCDAVLMSLLPG